MNKYELTLVLDGKVASAKKKAIQELIEKAVALVKGKIEKVEDWGVKDLAYPIWKYITGAYLHFKLELEALSVKQILIKLKTEEAILRHLLVKVKV